LIPFVAAGHQRFGDVSRHNLTLKQVAWHEGECQPDAMYMCWHRGSGISQARLTRRYQPSEYGDDERSFSDCDCSLSSPGHPRWPGEGTSL
jgi:hypothetical protein